MDKIRFALALSHCTFLRCREKKLLAEKLDNSESLAVLSIEDISQIVRRPIKTTVWKPNDLRIKLDRELELMERYQIAIVTVLSSHYPPVLRELHEPPFAVFWRGILPNQEAPLVAIVGTRAPSGNGALCAQRLGREFAEYGIPVVSGLARGIDAFAHRGTIMASGVAIAVVACGLERIYPKSNSVLAGKILEQGGCLVGEYPPGEEPLQFHFPQRNRLISGLSRSIIVVEAPEKSGALITADFALEQGRDLFVARDALDSSRGKGSSALYEQGAPSLDCAKDVLESWGLAQTDIQAMATRKLKKMPELRFPVKTGGQSNFVFDKGSQGKDQKN
ncbi:MAG TPA: DNA-protecting protein DprA [Treponema sp.]|nr:DNA-protecting protein DprA [Treponema sp.]